jgi:NADH:ubiquinone oxidoreductase subunit K
MGFVINIENFFKLLLYSEITWLTLYTYTILIGSINDDLTLLSTSLFIIGLAALEFSVGILLIIIFKNINKSITLDEVENNYDNTKLFNKKKTYINRYYWNK